MDVKNGKRQQEKVDVNTNDCALKSTFNLGNEEKSSGMLI